MLGPAGDSAANMLLDPLSFLQNVSAMYQPVVGLIMGGEEVILVADPAAAQQVLIDRASIYKKVCCWLSAPCSMLRDDPYTMLCGV